jgi:hypothetical protein
LLKRNLHWFSPSEILNDVLIIFDSLNRFQITNGSVAVVIWALEAIFIDQYDKDQDRCDNFVPESKNFSDPSELVLNLLSLLKFC